MGVCPDCGGSAATHAMYKDGHCPVVRWRRDFERMIEEPVPVPPKAQLDAVSLFRYGVPYDELPDDDLPDE